MTSTWAPADGDCEHGLSAELCMGPDHYPSLAWEMEREHFADDHSERYAGERIPDDWFDDEPWAWDPETGQPVTPTPFVPDPAFVPEPFAPREDDDDAPF